MNRYIGVNELADLLGVSLSTVYFWISKRAIPCYRIGRYRKFKMQEVEKWLEERKKSVSDTLSGQSVEVAVLNHRQIPVE